MIRQEEVFRIGRIGKPHGVKGETTFLFTDDVFDRVDADYLVLQVDGILVPFFMEEYRFRSNDTALIKFEGIDTLEQARNLTNCEVFFPRSLAEDQSDEVSWAQLTGMQLINNQNGQCIGTVTAVDDSTENVLLVINDEKGEELLIPAVESFIKGIDMEERHIRVELPEGLLNINH
ncbi:MAG: 16S rRNA processing protein RimM [Prevotella sp.]|nr:16S rRNA processing protein RimM [Prevotella sp.]MBR5929360.1 16S rRNA processing protein RimM [Prevotella sp.]